ncbi:HupE/UreJ family protein [Salinisphaera sp. P385]|uniref:HupE/UreJ family protein n=1 Tax=Spectribacter acetivorans TaxID=3075603 RepID=A0ABU3BCT2_9GAMM|nr:HupE/UreJ family protein [Salinisphaera sp. P385]MDT0619607.1 HupE/UreJ family protein [Salinisphaera sp. P385]
MGMSRIAAATLPALCLLASPAFAHHMESGQTPTGALAGLLSGLGHPLIGWDHALFLLAIGLLAAATGAVRAMPAAFVLTVTVGVAVQYALPGLPVLPWLAPATVLAVAAGMLARPGTPQSLWISVIAVAGLIHGQAYAQAIVGAEPTPLAAYLLGLALVQTALTVALALLVQRVPGLAARAGGLLRATGVGMLGLAAVLLATS